MWETFSYAETISKLNSDSSRGLSQEEAEARLSQNGKNRLAEKKKESLLKMFILQFNDPMIYILILAALISLVVGIIEKSSDWVDSIIIFFVVLLNATLGTIQENKANKAMESLKKLSSPSALVRREGEVKEIKAEDVVVGDIVLIEEGNIIPADVRLIKTSNFKTDESSLTGESLPVMKNADLVFSKETGVGDRLNMAYMSSICVYGHGEGIVVGTGMQTEIGRIASLLNNEEETKTPLQKKLDELSKVLGFITIGIVVLMLLVSLLRTDWSGNVYQNLIENFLLAISLAVAAVPEGLTAVVTIVLSLGVQRMAEAHTIVRKLPSVETLGAVDVVCSDKTGTLTQNKMTVVEGYVDGKILKSEDIDSQDGIFLSQGLSLCSNAEIDGGRFGDPTEIALVEFASSKGFKKKELESRYQRIDEYPFDSVRKMMSTKHVGPEGKKVVFTKGALDSILKHTSYILSSGQVREITPQDLDSIKDASFQMSSKALRILALAYKESDELTEDKLIFVGLVGMVDPARKEAKPAVGLFKKASIRTIMITGDHKDTALAIAKELSIAENESQCMSGSEIDALTFDQLKEKVRTINVFARVSPDNKVSIVKALKANGEIVAMTGDGVNDAPSLKAADIGIAMGITGTDVAKEAADMVLSDDNFASIEKAVEEGRNIYNNVKKTIIFLLSTNIAEVLIIFLTTACFGLPTPLISIHLLWVNLITDTFPALALGIDKKDPHIMEQKPRKADESLFANGAVNQMIIYSVLITLITIASFLYFPVVKGGCSFVDFNAINAYFAIAENGVYVNLEEAQSTAFTVLSLSELFHMFGMSDTKRSFIHVFKEGNYMFFISFASGLLLQILVTEIPGITSFFHTYQLSAKEWGFSLLLAAAPLYLHEILVFASFVKDKWKKGKKQSI
jgi:Ca2+-transporting ATPase